MEELVRQLTDLVAHRVEANLEAVRGTLLVDLPADRWVLGVAAAVYLKLFC